MNNFDRFTTYWEEDFYDMFEVFSMGARKYGKDNWKQPNGKKSSHKDMHASMFRHLANSQAGNRLDDESGMDHLLHLAARALMMYYIKKHEDPTGSKFDDAFEEGEIEAMENLALQKLKAKTSIFEKVHTFNEVKEELLSREGVREALKNLQENFEEENYPAWFDDSEVGNERIIWDDEA